MIRLNAVVEGQTEKAFVDQVLGPELAARDVFIRSRAVKTGQHRGRVYRGGISGYLKLKNDVSLWMKQEQQSHVWFTTMLDFYALPDDFPGFEECTKRNRPIDQVECLEQRLAQDLAHRRFIPYIQLHEFEALLFSDVSKFEIDFPNNASAIEQLKRVPGAVCEPGRYR
jgi:hypothetical protein